MGGNAAEGDPEDTGEPDGGNPCVSRGETGSRGARSLQSPQSVLERGELASVPPLRGLAAVGKHEEDNSNYKL